MNQHSHSQRWIVKDASKFETQKYRTPSEENKNIFF